MRLQEVITEALEWGNGPDKDIFMSLKGLVNNNNGVWKSTKQRWFMMNRKIGEGDLERAPELNKRFFGIETKEGQTLVTPEAMAQWAKYGSRSMIPVRYGFVVDEYGVVTYWRIGNKGNMSSGASPDPSKTKLEWTRPDDADVQHLIPSPEELKAKEKAKKKEFLGALGQGAGKHLGTEGERMKFEELTLIAKKSVGESYFGYNQSVEKFWNMYEDNYGNVVYHTGKEGPEKGQKISGAATVKKHIISKKGDNVTIVIRPRFKLIDAGDEMKVEEITEARDKWIVKSTESLEGMAYYVLNIKTDKYYEDSNGDQWYSFYKSNAQRKVRLLNKGIDRKQRLPKSKFKPDTMANTYGKYGVPQR